MLEPTSRGATERGLNSVWPFSDHSFDAVSLERLQLHISSPTMPFFARFLAYCALKLVAMEADFAVVMVADGSDWELARLSSGVGSGPAHLRIGRSLERLARAVGLRIVGLEAIIRVVRDFALASTGLRWRSQLASHGHQKGPRTNAP